MDSGSRKEGELATIELQFVAPIPRGHRVCVYRFEREGSWITGDAKFMVVKDLETHSLYSARPDAHAWCGEADALPSGVKRWTVVDGVVERVHLSTRASNGGLASRTVLFYTARDVRARRPLRVGSFSIDIVTGGLEERWPDGSLSLVELDAPFTIAANLQPVDAVGATVGVHVRVRQRREGRNNTIVATLALPTTPALLELPALARYYPRLEGDDALEVARLIDEACLKHALALRLL